MIFDDPVAGFLGASGYFDPLVASMAMVLVVVVVVVVE